MSFSTLRAILAAFLLAAILVPDVLPAPGHRCACGMTVGCCCLLKAAMKAGDHCALRRAAPPCGMRTGRNSEAGLLPRDRAGIGPRLRTGPPVLALAGTALLPDAPLPRNLATDPPTPPPRLVRLV
jgi:hypothetical protein